MRYKAIDLYFEQCYNIAEQSNTKGGKIMSFLRRKKSKHILRAVENADDLQSTEIVKALIHRYRAIDPQCVPVFAIFYPGDPSHNEQIFDMLRHQLDYPEF